jgi:4-diphosphocytidyl-2-C-methyl-D-erythritol kinase
MAGKSTARVVLARAPAKINLLLRVLERRADGFHELRTLFQSIALHDTLAVRAVRGPFQLECTDAACPTDRTNLVWRAAARVWTAAGRTGAPRNVAIRLTKRIPMQAGLGGGSSDAAAALRVLGVRWRVKMSTLRRIAASLGSDVPYFLEGGAVLAVGRGERLFPVADLPAFWVVLVMPGFGISTAEAYRWLDEERRRPVPDRRERDGASASGRGGGASREIINDLEAPVVGRRPEIGRLVQALSRAGAVYSGMSGSGSAVFGLFLQRTAADRTARALSKGASRVIVTRTLGRASYKRLAFPPS